MTTLAAWNRRLFQRFGPLGSGQAGSLVRHLVVARPICATRSRNQTGSAGSIIQPEFGIF